MSNWKAGSRLLSPTRASEALANFYLGHMYARIDGIDVYNWRNPLGGRSFFDSGSPNELSSNVAAVRTFDHRDQLIVSFVDDVHRREPPQPLFGRPAGAATRSPRPVRTNESPQQSAIVSAAASSGLPAGTPTARGETDHTASSEPTHAEAKSRTACAPSRCCAPD